ncbi:MAG: response regulator [Candidatus Pacebacteria bacterium]|nr:response regulator [Candidatus Paceibacterota bacterium]
MKILFLDDSETFLKQLKPFFAHNRNFEAFFALNFDEANAFIQKHEHQFACFVLDIQLSEKGFSGIDVARVLRRAYPETAIIMLTFHSNTFYYKEWLKTVADDCVSKTSDPDVLGQIIINAVNLRETKLKSSLLLESLLPYEKYIRFVSRTGDKHGAERLDGVLTKDNKPIAWDVYNLPSLSPVRNILGITVSRGCIGRCLFCLSGKRLFERNYLKEEILSQILHGLYSYHAFGFFEGDKEIVVNATCEGDTVFSNLDNVCHAFYEVDALNMGFSFIITTIGHQTNLERFLEKYSDLPVHFYWSLNFLNEELRAKFMPGTKGQSTAKLRDLFYEIARKTKKIVTVSWILMKGLNDSEEDVLSLAKFFKDGPFTIKIMALEPNSLPGIETKRSDVSRFANQLRKAGLTCREREIVGGKIKSGCGTTVPIDIGCF